MRIIFIVLVIGHDAVLSLPKILKKKSKSAAFLRVTSVSSSLDRY